MARVSVFSEREVLEDYLRKRYLDKKTGRVVIPRRAELEPRVLSAINEFHGLTEVRRWFGQDPLGRSKFAFWPVFRKAFDPYLVRAESGAAIGVPPERWLVKKELWDLRYAIKRKWGGWKGLSDRRRLTVIPQSHPQFKEWLRSRKVRFARAKHPD